MPILETRIIMMAATMTPMIRTRTITTQTTRTEVTTPTMTTSSTEMTVGMLRSWIHTAMTTMIPGTVLQT